MYSELTEFPDPYFKLSLIEKKIYILQIDAFYTYTSYKYILRLPESKPGYMSICS